MARKYLVSIDLSKNELQNARIQNLASAPANPVSGQIYYNTADNIMYFYNGTEFVSTSGSLEVIQDAINATLVAGTGLDKTYDDNAGTYTLDIDSTVATLTGTQTFTNKTLTSPVLGGTTTTSSGNLVVKPATNILEVQGDGASVVGQLQLNCHVNSHGQRIASQPHSENATNTLKLPGGTTIGNADAVLVSDTGIQTLTNKTLSSPVISMGSNKITGLGTPTDASDAATKGYVDSTAIGLDVKLSVRVATTANIDLTTDLENGDILDGVTLATGNRVLVKNQTNETQNGIYVVAASGVASRSEDANSDAEVTAGLFTFVEEGTVNGNTGFVLTSDNPITLGSTNLVFSQFSGVGTFTAGAGLTLTGTAFSVDVTPSAGNASLINTGGAVEVKVNTNDGLEVTENGLGINNGTGLTFASGALVFDTSNGYGVRKLAFSVGDGTLTSIVVNHALGTRDVTVHIYDNASPYAQVEADVEHTDTNNITVKFAVAPTSNQYRVVIVG
jgi:hypothetical protein